jgi:hypothetical protein
MYYYMNIWTITENESTIWRVLNMDTCNICGINAVIYECKTCLIKCCKGCFEQHKDACNILKDIKYHRCQCHVELVKAYCCNCYQLICKECVIDNHVGRFTFVNDRINTTNITGVHIQYSVLLPCAKTKAVFVKYQLIWVSCKKYFKLCYTIIINVLLHEYMNNNCWHVEFTIEKKTRYTSL